MVGVSLRVHVMILFCRSIALFSVSFAFRISIPHSAIPHYTHTRSIRVVQCCTYCIPLRTDTGFLVAYVAETEGQWVTHLKQATPLHTLNDPIVRLHRLHVTRTSAAWS